MWDLMDHHLISIKIIEDLFDGVESDLNKKVQLNNKKDLLIYSYRVAGTVGLMMAKILNVKDFGEIYEYTTWDGTKNTIKIYKGIYKYLVDDINFIYLKNKPHT